MCRSGDEWLVGEKGKRAYLKASVQGEEPNQPPTTGWKFYNCETGKYDEDPGFIHCYTFALLTLMFYRINMSLL